MRIRIVDWFLVCEAWAVDIERMLVVLFLVENNRFLAAILLYKALLLFVRIGTILGGPFKRNDRTAWGFDLIEMIIVFNVRKTL